MMEKRGVIAPGITPPENDDESQKTASELEDHVTTRAYKECQHSCGCKREQEDSAESCGGE